MFMKPCWFCWRSAAWSIILLACFSESSGFVLGCASAFFLISLRSSERITSKPVFRSLNMPMSPIPPSIPSKSREDLRFLDFEFRLGDGALLAEFLEPLESCDAVVLRRRGRRRCRGRGRLRGGVREAEGRTSVASAHRRPVGRRLRAARGQTRLHAP